MNFWSWKKIIYWSKYCKSSSKNKRLTSNRFKKKFI